ncbi:MAG TPA: xanthine dehydrogenase family protein molybdopterin-binding subunit [Solirubrobacteraceae bacterium]
MGAIGVSRPRSDSEPKVLGRTRYAADLPVAGLLHGRLVLADDAHARLRGIEAGEARAVPGVVAVLTAADLPIVAGSGRSAEPLARAEVRWSGQPVALVVAESEATAADGAERVVVDAEPLPVVLDLEAAMAPGAPEAVVERDDGGPDLGAAHAAAGGGEDGGPPEELSGNVAGRQRIAAGDAEAALAAAAARASGRFHTSWMYQGYLEPQIATAWLEPEGDLVVSSSTQGAFATRDLLAELFGLSLERVRVRPAPLGGAFGGKLQVLEPLAAAAALALGRPVRVAMTRMEDMAAANPAPGELMDLEVGAAAGGELSAIRSRLVCDRGANPDWGLEPLGAVLGAGPYRWGAHALAGYGVLTNRVPFGAYRAPAAPPAAFALETLLDELAEALGADPIELRLRNLLRAGDTGLDGAPFPGFGGAECLERLREHPLWRRRGELPDGEGVGVALGHWPGGLEPAAAACRLDKDGRLTIVTSAVDMSGTETGFAAIAAEAFGVAPERVRVVAGDTASAPYAGMSGGSKIIYTVGSAVLRAAAQARERLLEVAAAELEIAPEDLELHDGEVRPIGAPARAIALEDLAGRVLAFGGRHAPIEGHAGIAQTTRAPGCAAHLSHVRVDRETGRVDVLGHVIAQDVGRALNPALVEGQMRGGVAQGLGWALWEGFEHDADGQLRTGSLAEYAMPSAELVPPIETAIVEVPAPDGPFGAKGIGEPPVVGVPAAVANAIHAAVGVRLRALPMVPERVLGALTVADSETVSR